MFQVSPFSKISVSIHFKIFIYYRQKLSAALSPRKHSNQNFQKNKNHLWWFFGFSGGFKPTKKIGGKYFQTKEFAAFLKFRRQFFFILKFEKTAANFKK
jgi:hypothetical protein